MRLATQIFPASFAAICFLLSGCTTTIIPPQSSAQPTTVCIVDYGRHASLVLPRPGGAVEYEYGEWKWFALSQNQSARIAPALFWPTQGTLGQRILPYTPNAQMLSTNRNTETVLSFIVPSDRAAVLREKLDARYKRGASTETYNAEHDMSFVKDPADYCVFHNCNHEVAVWLEQLGCKTRGAAIFAKFRVSTGATNRETGESEDPD
jgi:hypothetical protein